MWQSRKKHFSVILNLFQYLLKDAQNLFSMTKTRFPLLARMTYCCFYRAMQQSPAVAGMTSQPYFLLLGISFFISHSTNCLTSDGKFSFNHWRSSGFNISIINSSSAFFVGVEVSNCLSFIV